MTEEVQTGRNPIANIADIADIENPIANIADIADIANIADVTDIENPVANIADIADIANIAERFLPSQWTSGTPSNAWFKHSLVCLCAKCFKFSFMLSVESSTRTEHTYILCILVT